MMDAYFWSLQACKCFRRNHKCATYAIVENTPDDI